MGELTTQAATRPSPAAGGTFAKTPLLHLLVYALEKKLAGTIDIVSPDHRVASVLFVGGEPAKAHVSEPVSQLGEVLVELGFMTAEVLDRALAELEDARSAGVLALLRRVPADEGLWTRSGVEAGVREQMPGASATWRRCRPRRPTHITTGSTPCGHRGGFAARCRPAADALDAAPERAPQAHVEAALARVADSGPPHREDGGPLRLGLGAAERAAIELLRVRPLTVAEFPRISGLAEATRGFSRTCCS